MNPQVQTAMSLWLVAAALVVCAALWIRAWKRWRRGLPVIAYQPRRPAPWNGWHILAVAVTYVLAVGWAIVGVQTLLGPEVAASLPGHTTEHVVAQMIGAGRPWMIVVAFLAAGLVAPLVEEFLFRVLLQGWLEAHECRRRRLLPWLRVLPRASGPVVLASLLFAGMHFSKDGHRYQPEYIASVLIGQMIAGLAVVALAAIFIRLRTGATAADLGWEPARLPGDVRLGLLVALAVVPLAYLLQAGASCVLPKEISPDPFALFFFALALGAVYQRTHRIGPPLVLHMALNVTSLFLALAVNGAK